MMSEIEVRICKRNIELMKAQIKSLEAEIEALEKKLKAQAEGVARIQLLSIGIKCDHQG